MPEPARPDPCTPVIVVGAGSSGCALAARLSENPLRSVLLVEAGSYFRGVDAYPPELRSGAHFGASMPDHPEADVLSAEEKAKILGGTAARVLNWS